jgi:hypothetical protein
MAFSVFLQPCKIYIRGIEKSKGVIVKVLQQGEEP